MQPQFFARARYRLARAARRALFGATCVGCGGASYALCVECLPAASLARGLAVLGEPRPTAVLGAYRGAYARAIREFKIGRRDVGDVLIAEMALRLRGRTGHDAEAARAAGDLVLIGVPTTGARSRARGFDGGEFLARGVACAWRLPARACLRKLGHDAQRGKSRRERLAARGRFALLARPPERCALLVDDVVTTGATLRDIAAVLRENGIHVLGAIAAAYVP